MSHTPGPWRLHDMEPATVVAGKPGGEVANCLNGFGDQDANARVIAAAPELLEALKECADDLEASVEAYYANTKDYPSELRRYERDIEPVRKARVAISKATPSPEGETT